MRCSSHRGTATSHCNLQEFHPLQWGYLLAGDKQNAHLRCSGSPASLSGHTDLNEGQLPTA
nr:MAG TPA: hypothetical protein [Caudoviricetes sp.]